MKRFVVAAAVLALSGSGAFAAGAEGSQADIARLVHQIVRQLHGCWNPPRELAKHPILVTLTFSLNRDGTLAGPVAVKPTGSGPVFEAAAQSAVRAVRKCTAAPAGPMRLPAAKYQVWRDIEVNFDPSELFDGAEHKADSSYE